MAVVKAVADKQQLQLLDLDANEIPATAIDNIKASRAASPVGQCMHAIARFLVVHTP